MTVFSHLSLAFLTDGFGSADVAALETKLLSHICEDGERHLFSSVPSSRLPPGVPEVSGNVRKPPYRTDTDTSTFTGDFRRVQMVVRRNFTSPSVATTKNKLVERLQGSAYRSDW